MGSSCPVNPKTTNVPASNCFKEGEDAFLGTKKVGEEGPAGMVERV